MCRPNLWRNCRSGISFHTWCGRWPACLLRFKWSPLIWTATIKTNGGGVMAFDGEITINMVAGNCGDFQSLLLGIFLLKRNHQKARWPANWALVAGVGYILYFLIDAYVRQIILPPVKLTIIQHQLTFFNRNGAVLCAPVTFLLANPVNIALCVYDLKFFAFPIFVCVFNCNTKVEMGKSA